MKVALLTDTHGGVRNDAPAFLDMTKRFMDDVFLPTIRERGVRQVIHLGDILDRRKYVNINTANRVRNEVVVPIIGAVERFDLILGNHDVYHRNTNGISGPIELWNGMCDDHFRIHRDPGDGFLLDGTAALFLPWINPSNHSESMDVIRKSRAQLCFGHLELKGFEMYRGQVMEEGMDPFIFHKFDMTLSGHYHHKSSRNGIHFLGAHGEFTWSDYDDERGFHVFDTLTRELEFIPNPYRMFEKVWYDQTDQFSQIMLPEVTGRHVKLIVKNKDDQDAFEEFISVLESRNPLSVQVVDDHLNAGRLLDDMDEVDESEDTLTIIRKALCSAEFDASRIDVLVTALYNEALSVE